MEPIEGGLKFICYQVEQEMFVKNRQGVDVQEGKRGMGAIGGRRGKGE